MSDFTTLLKEKPWVKEYLYFDPNLVEGEVIFEENLNKFKHFVQVMEKTQENKVQLLSQYNLPDHKDIIDLLAVLNIMRTYGPATKEQHDAFLNALSTHIKEETKKDRTLDDIFEDKDALALGRLYQVTEEKWSKKYLTWILSELGAISLTEGPDVLGANESAFQTWNFLKEASHGKWRPQMHFSEGKNQ